MKFVKYFFYALCAVLMVLCVVTLIYAFNPSMTDELSDKLYGNELAEGNQEPIRIPVNEDAGLNGEVLILTGNGGYVVPSKQDISTPIKVIGMSGFQSVQTENQQIAEENSQLTVGESGEGLSFSTLMYPYYGMLEGTMKQLYAQIYSNAMAGMDCFAPVVNVDVNQLKNVFEAVYNDHPELFWLEGTYTCKYLPGGKCVEIQLFYNDTLQNLAAAKEEFQGNADRIIRGAMTLTGDYARAKYVHDQLLNKVSYDTAAQMNQSAYSALVNGLTVCAGYSRAYQYMLQQLGIPCYYCTGYSGMDHAWNIVKLGDLYYNVDTTWDDTNPNTLDYYNKSDIELSDTHMRTGLSVYLPACVKKGSFNHITGDSLLEGSTSATDSSLTDEEQKELDLEEAGIKEEDVCYTLQDYYADCKKQMKESGIGKDTFVNVIPESLWTRVEADYIDDSYNEMYVRQILKELDAEHFAIQLQVQRLGGGYYRLYHNISIWNDPEPETTESSEEDSTSAGGAENSSSSSTQSSSSDQESSSAQSSSSDQESSSTQTSSSTQESSSDSSSTNSSESSSADSTTSSAA